MISCHCWMRGVQNSRNPASLLQSNNTAPPQFTILDQTYLFVTLAMMVCAICKGLQKNLEPAGVVRDAGADALPLVDTFLPDLRASATGCRACGLLLQGILLHHDRFKKAKESDTRITACTFKSVPDRDSQDHLSVEVRWKEDDNQEDDKHGNGGWPNLKLEYFTDGGRITF